MNKTTVMIVDDDKLAIEDLISLFDWEENGFEIVATAFNGKQALSKFREISPQIVITDIKMPFMDGLELIREIRSQNYQTKILLLTAYGEFEYAKSAIKQGVTDYLLKSEINKKSLSDKLLELKNQIVSENRTSSFLLQKVIIDLFSYGAKNAHLEYLSDPSVEKLLKTPYYYFIIKEDSPLPFALNHGCKHTPHYEYEIISHCMSASFAGGHIECAGIISGSSILLLIRLNDDISQQSIHSVLMAGAKSIQRELSACSKSTFSIFLLRNKQRLTEACESYLQLRDRIHVRYFLGRSNIYDLQDKTINISTKDISVDDNRLSEYMGKQDCGAVLSYIDELFAQVLPPNINYEGLISITQSLYSFLKKSVEALPPTSDKSEISLDCDETHWMDAKGIKSWMKYKFESLIHEWHKQLENKHSHEIIKAIGFIYKNHNDKELKISKIANEVGLSPARLSVIFKKETGKTINEFITDYRINKAKKLLDEGSYKVYEIAEMVGYGTSQYFSQIFYQETGFSPYDYKKRGTK